VKNWNQYSCLCVPVQDRGNINHRFSLQRTDRKRNGSIQSMTGGSSFGFFITDDFHFFGY